MAEHKNQHIVPRTYLEKFIASEIPAHLRDNPKVEPGVYVRKSNAEDGWKMVSVDHKTFTSSYFYNTKKLENELHIEINVLRELEGAYSLSALKVINNEPLNHTDKSNLLTFMAAQFFRTKRSQSNMKEFYDGIADALVSFQGQEYAGRDKGQFNDLEKLSLIWSNEVLTDEHTAIFVENSTKIPFITSDNPVFRYEERLEVLAKLIPQELLKSCKKPFDKTVVFFMALSPTKAVILSKDIKSEYDLRLFRTDSLIFANTCYDLVVYYSDEFVVSDRDCPDRYCRKRQTVSSIENELEIKFDRYIRIESEIGIHIFQIEEYESSEGFNTKFLVKLSDRKDLSKVMALTGKVLSFKIVDGNGVRFNRENKTISIVDKDNAVIAITR